MVDPTRRDETGAPRPTRRYPLNEPVDAVVVGTGAGGAPLTARLAAAGLSVVALEAGRWWDPAADFATDESAQSGLFWNDDRLSEGGNPIHLGRNNSGAGVGGSTLHYTGFVPRAQPDDFRIRSEFGVGVDWPIGYDDLAPYYAEVERTLGVSGPSPYPWGPPRSAYPLPPLPLNGAAQLMERGAAFVGIETSPAANAALSQPYYQEGIGWRGPCIGRGFCQAGCSVGAKGSMDVTYIPLAVHHGAEIRPDSRVVDLERAPDGRVAAVVYRVGDELRRQPCRAVFLCAGAVETPRLLLHWGIANGSGEVGRNFMAHVGPQLWGEFDDDVRPNKGIPAGLVSEAMHRPSGADFAGGYLLQSIGVMPVTYASQLARGLVLWGPELIRRIAAYNHVAGINILGDCLPSTDNTVSLADEVDPFGIPVPRVAFTAGDNERAMARHAMATMRAVWEAAGARDMWEMPRFAHLIGTCRMGDDPSSSVVDRDGRAHDVPNLYVADNSVFPSALGVNPALTIMALSLRTADRHVDSRRHSEA